MIFRDFSSPSTSRFASTIVVSLSPKFFLASFSPPTSHIISIISPRRYIENNSEVLRQVADPHAELLLSLVSILNNYPPRQPFQHRNSGLYSGSTSIAYLFLWLSQTHNLRIHGKLSLEWCHAYLDCSRYFLSHRTHGGGSSPRAGIHDPLLSYHAILASATKSSQSANDFLEAVRTMHQSEPVANNELLYGRAGTLALLRIVRHFVPSATAIINTAMTALIEHIIANEPWTWHGKQYTGAVHGDIGIITQIVLSDPSYAARLEPHLRYLLTLQTSEGHWDPHPTQDLEKHHHLVQICHGTPGFLVSLVKLLPHFPTLQASIESAIQQGREFIWQKGLLRKEPNLCHGTAGNALALEKGERREHFLAFTQRDIMDEYLREGIYMEGEDLWGLWCGEGGRAWVWMVQSAGLELGIPGFSDV